MTTRFAFMLQENEIQLTIQTQQEFAWIQYFRVALLVTKYKHGQYS
jgi:hypothetical protein